MKNVSHSPVTEMLSSKYKIWLIIGLALLPIADLSACIVLWVFGAASSYWILPLLMTIVDLLYLLGVALSNQRFRYALTLFIFYIFITIIFVIIWLAKFAGGPVVLANTALSAWALLHVVGILAVAISYLYASRRFRFGRHVQLVLAIVFTAVVLLCAVFYGVTVIGDGYFGQGHGNLPLVYNYIFGGECEVSDVIYGKGDSVVVPYEFNGRKVTRVSSKLFTYANIKSVTLNCDSDVELCDDIVSSTLNTNIKIYADKKDVDTVKQKLYNTGNLYDDFYKQLHELGNNVRPIGLDKDEVYIAFDYDRNSYYYAQRSIIPTWYGKKGDMFKLSDIEGVDYVEYSDANSDEHLYYCYNNAVSGSGGYIMSELRSGGKALDGSIIDSSRAVPVNFQRIYKVFAGVSNDYMYDAAEHFSFTTVNGVKQDYKLTVLDKADELLLPFDRGEAFTRTMQYRMGSSDAYRPFTSLSALLGEGYDNVTITPHWELVKPQIALSSVTAEADIIYGDDFELAASVTHPLGDVQVKYIWYDDVLSIGDSRVLKTNAKTTGTHTYTAIVKLSAPDVTSLTASNAAEIKVNVNKRPLTVSWEHKSVGSGDDVQFYGTESVFDGVERAILPKAQNVVNDDFVFFMGYAGYNAGTHTVSATLSSDIFEKYYIAEGETYTYTIHPRPVPLAWDEQTEFEYDRTMHRPTAHAKDLDGNELIIYYLAINYSGIGTWIDAGEYSVIAEIQNTNYTIDEDSKKTADFKITPKPVITLWGQTQLTYNGGRQAPTATALGVDDENVVVNVSGGQTNANVINGNKVATYTATAVSADKNYTLTGSTSQEYTIEPMEVRVEWSYTSLVYNGDEQAPTATAKGVNGVDLPLTVTGGVKIGAGVAKAEFAAEQQNYTLNSATKVFGIERKTLTVTVQDATYAYGQSVEIDLDVKGVVNDDDVIAIPTAKYEPDEDGNVPVGEYDIIVQLDGEDKDCYKVEVVRQGKLTVTAPPEQAED